MRDLILAIDQGTTNSKALLVDPAGAVVAVGSDHLALQFPQPGWVECDGLDLWESVLRAVGRCLVDTEPDRIAAVAVTNQRESVLVWDRRTGEPLGPCISWQCRRTSASCDALRERGLEPILRERTGLGIDPLFSATKARWLLDRVEDASARIARGDICLGTIDSWLVWNLTGSTAFTTDVTNASRTQLLDIGSAQWDPDLAELFEIPIAILPEVRASDSVVGTTVATGPIPAKRPIAGVIGDSHGALFGHGAPVAGAIKATFGTGTSVMTQVDGTVRAAGVSTTIAWGLKRTDAHAGVDTTYALEGNITATGATLDWLSSVLGLVERERELDALARTVDDAAGVSIVPAFAGLGAPYWDADARGLITGLTRGSTSAHLARAAFESIAFQVRDVIDSMRATLPAPPAVLLADGGAINSDLLLQLQADVLQLPVERFPSGHASGVGAALLTGLALGWWRDLAEIRRLPRNVDRAEPQIPASIADEGVGRWRHAVARALGPSRDTLPVSVSVAV